jgi:hypothetical protein
VAAKKQATAKVTPLSQKSRPKCSLPLPDADLAAGNANWMRGLQAMSDWIWSGNLNPQAFPNNLGRFFLQIPGVFEQQLNFSTTLLFDEPSFCNGVQRSGFIDRVVRELVISYIAHRRRCWYSMTHHAILGKLTASKHGLSDKDYTAKWSHLTEYKQSPNIYTRVERAALAFAEAFATNPKAYTDVQFNELKAALMEDNRRRYPEVSLWLAELASARDGRARGLLRGLAPGSGELDEETRKAAKRTSETLPDDLNDRWVNAQIVELAFVCLQFVALSCIFTGLNIPDEDFLAKTLQDVVPSPVIEKINELNRLAGKGIGDLVPPPVEPPLDAILKGDVTVEPVPRKGTRIPLVSYEVTPDRDKGLTTGGVQVGVWGWSFGMHFPGGLVYALMHHPELARFEAPYSLPVLFNEDEWRNGVQTSGFVTRRLKEMAIQKVYRILRSRYGLEHHTMFFYNDFLKERGGGVFRRPWMTDDQAKGATDAALKRAEKAALYMHCHMSAPEGVFSALERATLTWIEALLCRPHEAYKLEAAVRKELDHENRREILAGLRRLDTSRYPKEETALKILQDHQIAELAMVIGHMDGLGRALTILCLESEDPVQAVKGGPGPTGGILPDLDSSGQVQFTGYFNNRPGLLDILRSIGLSDVVFTVGELLLNQKLNDRVRAALAKGQKPLKISMEEARPTAEF